MRTLAVGAAASGQSAVPGGRSAGIGPEVPVGDVLFVVLTIGLFALLTLALRGLERL